MKNQALLLWHKIIERGNFRTPEYQDALNLLPGAADEELTHLEDKIGTKLPEEMKHFYKVHNGQNWTAGSHTFVRNLTLLPLSAIRDSWNFLQEEFDPDGLEMDIEPGIKPMLWNSKWIPIAENGAGDYLCLDTDPAGEGTYGQVLYFWHDWGNRSVEAANLYDFIENCLQEEAENED
ncbi:SMI1/KNR4 family protein [Paenibacillus sp. HJL G12]|uniref:SMI1/KNR4 family protein n=1 Tax=Paenibacillus dendrobii TaxID=2691084 RepID=A0A7X3IH21_9BACL|nr:SMI1/KNR4 family protein [Paenibacillus dendrobii]MWV43331.1 SMI1/KNR4 family protein [Paenibacillus dendrobii]